MPARRLPWVKLWGESMESEKIRQLSDGQYRTWTYCLIASSRLPIRWRFESPEHAAYVTRRPLKDIQILIDRHFLDCREDGVWIHDYSDYQEVSPSDVVRDRSAQETRSPDEPPRNGRRKVGEASANGRQPLGEHSLEIETEREMENNPPTPQGARRKNPVREPLTDADSEALVAKYSGQFGGRQGVLDEIASAMNHVARLKSFKERLYVDGWLRREVNRPNLRLVNNRIPPQPSRPQIDLTGTEN